MFLDILYTLQQFVAPLPEDYDEFKVNFLFRFLKTFSNPNTYPFYVPLMFKEIFFYAFYKWFFLMIILLSTNLFAFFTIHKWLRQLFHYFDIHTSSVFFSNFRPLPLYITIFFVDAPFKKTKKTCQMATSILVAIRDGFFFRVFYIFAPLVS